MKKSTTFLSTLAIAFAMLLTSCGGEKTGSIAGAGATFPLPFYNVAFKAYQETTGNQVTYGGVGSGGGIRSLKDRIVDFAGSDAYLSEKEMEAMPAEVIHIPSCLGAVVIAYNLPGVDKLVLDGEIVADIYLNKITKWNDARIVALNPGVNLPDMTITPVFRSDGSGTTFVFTDYMTKVSSQWANDLGRAKALKWPVGIASKGNPGVAGTVKETVGSVGYIGSEYGFALKIPSAALKNRAGKVVVPSLESISASATSEMPADMRAMITNSPAAEAYPISCWTWLLVYADQSYDNRTEDQARFTIDLMKWMMTEEAQSLTTKVHYAPLPASVVKSNLTTLNNIKFNGKKLYK
ncbi:MAG: phosphate ABC transporter substrate-binding protein PstS [Rikenellaceae bacterium]